MADRIAFDGERRRAELAAETAVQSDDSDSDDTLIASSEMTDRCGELEIYDPGLGYLPVARAGSIEEYQSQEERVSTSIGDQDTLTASRSLREHLQRMKDERIQNNQIRLRRFY